MRNSKTSPKVLHRSLHLDESNLEPPDSQCPFCGSSNRQRVYALQETPEVSLLRCNACHAVSASRMPTDEALSEYYSGYYDSSASQDPDGQITLHKPQRLARNLADTYRRYQGDAQVSILDFGGGDGTVAYLTAMQLIERGVSQVRITVVEYSKEIVSSHDSRIVVDRVDSLSEISSSYGLVIASAVIEHYPHPRALMRDLLQCLEKGGIFYARTPFMLPLMQLFRLFGAKVDFTYPAHLHDLGQNFWEGYFKNEQADNFQVLQSRPSLVETTLRTNLLRTLAAYFFKAPWYVLGRSYKYVGGWEVFVRKDSSEHTASPEDQERGA